MLDIMARGQVLAVQYSGAFLVAFLLTLLLTPLAKRIAIKLEIFDKPADHKLHDSPVPYLGGLAILVAFIAAIFFYRKTFWELAAILGFAVFLSVIGLVDDNRGMKPSIKLAAQILAALGVFAFGVRVQLFGFLPFDLLLTVFWIVGITNAFNLLDNMDGLSVGTSAICAFFFFVVAAFNEQYLVASLSSALFGACLGFLYYNFNPASIFMGDAGSLLLGFFLAVIGIKLRFTNVKAITFGVPILVLGFPIFDTALVTISRKLHGVSIFQGGKDHSSHRLVKMGMSQRLAVLMLYLVSASLGSIALVLSTSNEIQATALLGAILGIGIAAGLIFYHVSVYQEEKAIRGNYPLRVKENRSIEGGTVSLRDRIASKSAKVGVAGLGYVGLPLAVEIAKTGFETMGIDLDKEKVDAINSGANYIPDLDSELVEKLARLNVLKASTGFDEVEDLDIVLICVPTPLNASKEPDISAIVRVVECLVPCLRKDQLIVLESTSYPGTTEEEVLPRLEKSGLKVGRDFYLAFSPERVDPGNKRFNIKSTPKVVGGVTEKCRDLTKLFYGQIVDEVVAVSSTRVAEMTKLLENIFRCVNIALVNELMILCERMEINIWEVIEAASTKPFGYMPFYPGPGLGGHCIPVDPFYLSWKAREYDFHTEFIELSGKINQGMPYYVVSRITDSLNQDEKSLKGSRVLILGVTYKRDISDLRESPALKVIELLAGEGADVAFHDPFVREVRLGEMTYESNPLDERLLRGSDCTVIITDHSDVDYQKVVNYSKRVIDMRNVVSNLQKELDIVEVSDSLDQPEPVVLENNDVEKEDWLSSGP